MCARTYEEHRYKCGAEATGREEQMGRSTVYYRLFGSIFTCSAKYSLTSLVLFTLCNPRSLTDSDFWTGIFLLEHPSECCILRRKAARRGGLVNVDQLFG